MDIEQVLSIVEAFPRLRALPLLKLTAYTEIITLFKPQLSLLQPSTTSNPPERLPLKIHTFLLRALDLEHELCKEVYHCFRDSVWQLRVDEATMNSIRLKHVPALLEHGLPLGLGVWDLYPPCLSPDCQQALILEDLESVTVGLELNEPRTFPITVFTEELGAMPGYSTSLYCRRCNTRYHNNYYIHANNASRTYYPSIPLLVQAEQHIFMSSSLCEFNAVLMAQSWTSARNCAAIFNDTHGQKFRQQLDRIDWKPAFTLDVEPVLDGFFLYSLIIHHVEHGTLLLLPHDAPSQLERLRPALHARNQFMAGIGQEFWNHACKLCTHEQNDGVGNTYVIRSTVTDGLSMGHPCCRVHDCQGVLPTVKHRFCAEHQNMEGYCCAVGCTTQAQDGFKTCAVPEHRKIENFWSDVNSKSVFLLSRRRDKHNSQVQNRPQSSALTSVDEQDIEDDDIIVDASGVCDGKSDTGNRARANFGRRRTHNEQICVYSCGVIIGRATFFGSEAANGVRLFWMTLFPTLASLPSVLWFDNNCRVSAMINADPDPHRRHYFDHVALPVDVFHFKTKHTETDNHCQSHCNPALWPELMTEDKKWRFNSSAAEQTNAWFGNYHAIVREMQVDRFNFFLDEMIRRRNRRTVAKLAADGHEPWLIPLEYLLGRATK